MGAKSMGIAATGKAPRVLGSQLSARMANACAATRIVAEAKPNVAEGQADTVCWRCDVEIMVPLCASSRGSC
jgi:hypothetical protein